MMGKTDWQETKKIIYAIAALSGTIIGVGFFSLPYLAVQVGIWPLLVYFAVLGGVVLLLHLLFAEVALKTPDFLRLPGYAKLYFGEKGKIIAFIIAILGIYGAILAYLIIGGKFLEGIFQPFLGGSYFVYVMVYFFLGSLLIFAGIRPLAKICFFEILIFSAMVALFFISGRHLFQSDNLLTPFSWSRIFLPYGPILFSLWGAAMIPEVEEMLGDRKILLKKVVAVSVIIPIVIYFLFALAVAGISGAKTSADAISGLSGFLGGRVIILGYFVGLVTTFTSFVALGLTLEKVFRFDFEIPRFPAFFLVCAIPISLFIFGVTDFLSVISVIGSMMMGLEGLLIVLMYRRIEGKKLLLYPLVLVLLGGIIYEILNFI